MSAASRFTGRVVIPNFYTNATVSEDRDTFFPLDLRGTNVTWDPVQLGGGFLPASLQQINYGALSRLATLNQIDLQVRTVIVLTGRVGGFLRIVTFRVVTRFSFNYPNNSPPTIYRTYPANQIGSLFYYPYTPNNSIIIEASEPDAPVTTTRIPTQLGIATASSTADPVEGFTVALSLELIVQLRCTSTNLNTDLCQDFCRVNQNECFTNYLNFCLPPNSSEKRPRMLTDSACRTFFSDASQTAVSTELSNRLDSYCQSKYNSFADLYNDGLDSSLTGAAQLDRTIDRGLCACHMKEEQYDKYSEQINRTVKGISNAIGNKYCLFPECASSRFKNPSTGVACPTARCINVAGFINNGTVEQVTIDQTAPGCANLQIASTGTVTVPGGKNTPPPPSSTQPAVSLPQASTSTTTPIIIGSVIGIVIIIVLIIIIISVSRNRPVR